jgi:hypothetical protein
MGNAFQSISYTLSRYIEQGAFDVQCDSEGERREDDDTSGRAQSALPSRERTGTGESRIPLTERGW